MMVEARSVNVKNTTTVMRNAITYLCHQHKNYIFNLMADFIHTLGSPVEVSDGKPTIISMNKIMYHILLDFKYRS